MPDLEPRNSSLLAPPKKIARRQMLTYSRHRAQCHRRHALCHPDPRLRPLRREPEADGEGRGLAARSASSTQFPEGQTRLATYRNPLVRPWDGDTGDIPCWVRRISTASKLQVFAINCAHLGCPVRWFPQSGACSCARATAASYYADGSRASGPPPRGLFEYDYKIEGDELWIKAGQLPTLAAPPSVAAVVN